MKLCLRCNQYFNDTLEMCPKDQAPLEEVGKDPIIGALIDDRYVIDSVIGKGSSGIVYKASRLMMGGDVAVKVIHSYLGADSASLDRLLRELKAAERLRHAHVITVWDSGTTDDGQPYLVMDYCEGITLSQLITQKGALPPKRVLNVLRQVTEALGHAHEQGFIHRDMKPENIVLEESELRGDYVKVLDFGIADTPAESAQRAKFNKPKTVAGSPAYMSPEQCQGFELDYRSDLYSLAVIAFEMFTGRRPFLAHDLMKLMYMTVTEPPPKMGQVRKDLSFPERVEAVIAKALSKLPDERQPTIRDFWKELEQACEGQDFGKSDRVKQASREQQNVADLEILPSERLIDDEKPKRPQFEAGPEDMPELFMPPPPPPKSNAAQEEAPPAAKSPNSSPPPPPPPAGGAPVRGPGIASLVNKQQQPGAAPAPAKPPAPGANPVTPGPSVSGTVKPLQPTRIGPGGAKLPTALPKPGEPQRPPTPGGPRPLGPGTGPTAGKGPPGPPGSSAPPGPPKAPPPPGAPGSGGPRPAGGPPPSPTAAPPLPAKPPSPNPSNGPAMGLESSDAYSQFPDKTMSRLSALVKRPTSAMAVPAAGEFPPAPAKPAAEPAPERPPSVYSYVPPKEEKPPSPEPEAKTADSNNNQNPSAGAKPTALPAKPGGPNQAKPGGPGGPKLGGPGGSKPGGPNQVKPGGAPQGSKPGSGPNPGGPAGAKPNVQNKPSGAPGGPSGAKTGESSSGSKPGGAPQGSKPAPTGAKPAPKPDSASPASAKPADKPEPGKSESNKSEPNKAESKPGADKTEREDSELTPALARAGATWVESSAEWDSIAAHSLDGNLDESKQSPQRRISNLDWEDEIEALKTGSVDPIVIEPGPGGELLNSQQSGAWTPGMVPPGGPQNPNQMPPQGMPPGYPPQNWPPGMMPGQPMMPGYDQNMSYPPGMIPGQPMMPGYDQNMSYPPGMMHPYMQPPGYPPGYPLPPNQDVSGAYPMMPNYPPMPPPGQDVSGTYQVPGYMPPGQSYPYGAPGMPMMMPGMPGMPPQGMPPGMPPQGMPPGMVPQGMPPGMVPQGMPPGMVPQGYPPGMPPQGMPPFMNPPPPDAASGTPGGLGSALLDDLKSDFGDTPQGDSLDDLFEDVPPEEEAPKAEAPKVEEEKKTEFAKDSEPATSNDLAVPLDKFEKFEDTDESLKQKELAAKSEAEAAELGDSLLALMESTEKDRGGSIAEKTESKPEKKEDSPKSTGSRALGSLLGALTASDDDLEEPAESEESGGNAFAQAVASSASVPSLTEKGKKSGSAFGQLLAAVKEDDEGGPADDDEDDNNANAGGASLPKQAISDALDDLLGPDDPSVSVNRAPAMKNPFERDDDLLGDGNAIVKPSDSFPTAAARLASALSDSDDDDEPEPPYSGVDGGSITSGATPQNPSTSTSDALSRLLEAASKAPSKASESVSGGPAMSEIDKMAARVNKPPAKVSRKLASAKTSEGGSEPAEPQPFSGFGGGGGAFGGGNFGNEQPAAYGGAPDMRSSGINSTGSNSSYSQDAVNARIAELNRKLEQQSIGRKDVELPQAPPPDPSVIGDSPNRRDVVNRIMEEAGKRHQYGADYESPEPAPSAKPTVSGSNFNPNELDKVNSSRLASMAEQEQRRKKSRSRNATMPRFPVIPVVGAVAIIGLCTLGYFNQEPLKKMWDGIMSSVPAGDATTEKKDNELLAKVNDLVAKGKLNEARKILEQEEAARGLPPEWSDKLDTIYISIAKYKKNAGATPEAIKTLDLIPNESSHYQEAQKLIKQYKGSKKSSAKRKRR